MRFLRSAILATFLILPVSSANADVLATLLSFDGIDDVLTDDSRSSFFDNDMNGLLSQGDVFYGFAAISEINSASISDQIVGAFAVEITGMTNGVLEHGGVGTVNTGLGQDLGSLLGAGLGPIDNGLGDSAFVVLSHAGSSPESLTFGSLSDFTAAEWAYEATLGFGTGSNDFLHILPNYGGGNFLGAQESGGFTVLDNAFAPGAALLSVNALSLINGGNTQHDVGLELALLQPNTDPGNPWMFNDQAQFRINAVPEPNTVAFLAGLFGITLVRRRRRS